MAPLVKLLYILLINDIVSGQAIIGKEYTIRGTLYGNDDNTIEIKANQDGSSLVELLGATDGSELDGWYLESSKGLTLLTYWRTRSSLGNIYWDYYTEPDIYPSTTYIAHTMNFRATFTLYPTNGPTTSEPTAVTSTPTTGAPTLATSTPTVVPSFAPTVFVYLHEKDQLPSLGSALGIYGQYAIMGDQSYGKLANDAGSAGPGVAYVFDLDTVDNTYVSLIPSDSAYPDAFGMAVYINGDYAAISAPYKKQTINYETIYGYGTVYIYKRTTGNQWQQMTNFQPATDPGYTHLYFGQRIMMKGDYILVGTHMGNSAYIFKKDGETWNEMAALTPDASINCCQWGDALNEMHLDNTATYVLISYTWNSNEVIGKVFLFKRTVETWSQIETLTSPNSESGNYQFGRATVMYDDYIAITEHDVASKVYIYTIDKTNGDVVTLVQTLSVDVAYGSPLAMYGDILSVAIDGGDEIWIYQVNGNGQFEKVNTLLTSNGGSFGSISRTVLQGNILITSGVYVYDIDPSTGEPTVGTIAPTSMPSAAPTTDGPTAAPITDQPSVSPTEQPTAAPVTNQPSAAPITDQPTASPITEQPTDTTELTAVSSVVSGALFFYGNVPLSIFVVTIFVILMH